TQQKQHLSFVAIVAVEFVSEIQLYFSTLNDRKKGTCLYYPEMVCPVLFHQQTLVTTDRHNKNFRNQTCSKAGTIEDALKRSSLFREVVAKNKNKELVILREGKAISSHCPCSVIKNDQLIVKYIKPVDKYQQSRPPQRVRPSGEFVLFHVCVKGGKNIVRIMRNPALKTDIDEITVYAYKGEKVKHALKRDGRLEDIVFKKTYSQPGSLDDGNVDWVPEKSGRRKIQNSEKMRHHLSLQVKVSVKGLNNQQVSKISKMQNLFRQEYGKKDQTCREVKTMKKLMKLSDSVCHVRINGRPEGTAFLLFDNFVLTNCHVIKKALDVYTMKLSQEVTVHFSYESLDDNASGVKVVDVACFEFSPDESGIMCDWALLRLDTCLNLPDCLLPHFGLLPPSGAICIIGHPNDGVKKIDPCLIVPTDCYNQVVEKHHQENPYGVQVDGSHYSGVPGPIQWVTPRFFDVVEESVGQKKRELLYESCFYFGSSGSPVFDENCNVVAVHSGGYVYDNTRGERHSVIEYGHCLSYIIERILLQIVRRQSLDVLGKYLSYAEHSHVIDQNQF
uniref:Serine protease n=1 Tax=Mola mola TaxID=94237 RepID=A0A3Q3WJL1_MOLML